MASFNFGLLELADGECGEAAVSVVVSKAKTDAAAHANKPAEASAAENDKDKAVLKNLYYYKLQHDNGVRNIEHELKRLRELLIKLRGEETKLKERGENGHYLIQLSEEQRELSLKQLSEEQRKLRQQQKRLREQEAKLRPLRKEFYLEHGFPLGADEAEQPEVANQGKSVEGNDNAGVDNGNGGHNSDGCAYHDGERDVHADGEYVYHERQVEEGYAFNNNGGRQRYPEVHNKKVQMYVVKQSSSNVGTEADHKSEEKVTSDVGSESEHKPVENDKKAATPANADAAPPSGSEKSSTTGAAASNKESNKVFPKQKINGSEKRKRKSAKKNGGNDVDKAKKDSSEANVSKKTDKEPLADYPREVEKKTLAEYERIREEKKSSSEEVSRSEGRKVSAEEFKGLQMLEKKKLDDEETVMKADKVQHRAKETTSKKEEKVADVVKPKKVVIPLKELSFAPPAPRRILEDGSSNGGGAPRGRFNGGAFQGRSRDNSTDSRAPAGHGRDNGRAAQKEAGNYGNGAPRGGYSGGHGYGAPRFDYSAGRGDGGYGAPRGDYSGGHGDGAQGDRGFHNQGGNGGGYQQGGYPRRQGNDGYYRPRGRGYYSGNGRPAPKPVVVKDDMKSFPPLHASAPARAAAPAAAPAQSLVLLI